MMMAENQMSNALSYNAASTENNAPLLASAVEELGDDDDAL